MDEERYPSNTNEPLPKKDNVPAEKKLDKVTTGVVIQRKKPLGRKMKDLFIGGDTKTVGNFIVTDVIVPAIRDLIAEAISQTVDRMIYGEGRHSGGARRGGHRPSSGGGYTNYSRFSSSNAGLPWERAGRRDERVMSRRAKATHDFNEIILASRVEGEQVLDRMQNVIDRYSQITVGDLYEIIGLPADFTDEKYGWTSLPGAGVTRTREGYLLDLPQPEILG